MRERERERERDERERETEREREMRGRPLICAGKNDEWPDKTRSP